MFKVGDWVRSTNKDSNYINQIERIVGTSVFMRGESSYNHIDDLHMVVELWHPRSGEWCWIYTTADDDMPRDYHLVKCAGYQNERYCFTLDGKVQYKQLKDIQPFQGVLPSNC